MSEVVIPKIEHVKKHKDTHSIIILFASLTDLKQYNLSKDELDYVSVALERKENVIVLNQYHRFLFLVKTGGKGEKYAQNELMRKHGAVVSASLKKQEIKQVGISGGKEAFQYALLEGLLLASYTFEKYKSGKQASVVLKQISVEQEAFSAAAMKKLVAMVKHTLWARYWVNEPQSFLTATVFAKQIKAVCEAAGCTVSVLEKKKIEELKMGGLLAVNQGSVEPPTFTIVEWKPKNAKNDKPIVFVGKGVVYDTGGLSLKPTANSMDIMKCDMGGGAAAAGAIAALAEADAPYHVVALIPATDNRPSGNAYAPGDVVTMMNGKTVEVLNTDAEGRMILADALTYADTLKPQVIFNIATLTGSAMRAIGEHGTVIMGNAKDKVFHNIKKAGNEVYERTVRFPFWDEYGEEIKSKVADIKNLGSANAGCIHAGKFLAHFTDSPMVHFDIAGPGFTQAPSGYYTYGGTGVGVRLFAEYVLNH